jgi:hypothetical protein
VSPTHSITLTVTVDGPKQWEDVYQVLTKYAVNLGKECPNVTLTSYALDVYYDEDHQESLAELKVRLREAGFSEFNLDQLERVLYEVGYRFKKED